ncbi:hypothetical protein AUJ84_01390 [Candidatus Pacearchaeota archaeon CG1_02_32_132]|nr:MAG: hypothetical protein AUJ84_01390 [Candidatus Pacearchaeota archaeon CG1_02_32_132]
MNRIDRIRRIGYIIVGMTLAGTIVASTNSKTSSNYPQVNPRETEQVEVKMLPAGKQDNLERKVDYVPKVRKENIGKVEVEKRLDYKTKDFSEDSNEVILARMIFGEARSCSDIERIAVGYTALTRANDGERGNGSNVKETILMSKQYSCFNSKDSNRKVVMDPLKYDKAEFLECLEIAKGIIAGKYSDPSHGATNYFNPEDANPPWAESNRMTKIGRIDTEKGLSEHVFYKEK